MGEVPVGMVVEGKPLVEGSPGAVDNDRLPVPEGLVSTPDDVGAEPEGLVSTPLTLVGLAVPDVTVKPAM